MQDRKDVANVAVLFWHLRMKFPRHPVDAFAMTIQRFLQVFIFVLQTKWLLGLEVPAQLIR